MGKNVNSKGTIFWNYLANLTEVDPEYYPSVSAPYFNPIIWKTGSAENTRKPLKQRNCWQTKSCFMALGGITVEVDQQSTEKIALHSQLQICQYSSNPKGAGLFVANLSENLTLLVRISLEQPLEEGVVWRPPAGLAISVKKIGIMDT